MPSQYRYWWPFLLTMQIYMFIFSFNFVAAISAVPSGPKSQRASFDNLRTGVSFAAAQDSSANSSSLKVRWLSLFEPGQASEKKILDFLAGMKDLSLEMCIKTVLVKGKDFFVALGIADTSADLILRRLDENMELILKLKELVLSIRTPSKRNDLIQQVSSQVYKLVSSYSVAPEYDFMYISPPLDFDSFPIYSSLTFSEYEVLYLLYTFSLNVEYQEAVEAMLSFIVYNYQRITETLKVSAGKHASDPASTDTHREFREQETEKLRLTAVYLVLQSLLKSCIELVLNIGVAGEIIHDYMTNLYLLLNSNWHVPFKITTTLQPPPEPISLPSTTSPSSNVVDKGHGSTGNDAVEATARFEISRVLAERFKAIARLKLVQKEYKNIFLPSGLVSSANIILGCLPFCLAFVLF
jgi:hypothetical protein